MTGDGSILLLLLDWKSPTLAPLARCGSGCSRSVRRLVERKFSPTSSGGQGEEEVSSSTDADGAVAVAALTGREDRRLWTASARRGSDQSQFAFPLDWKKRRSKQGFGQLEHSEASASYSKASASSSNNERLNNASSCCHELGRRWRGSSQLLHRCRWIGGSVGQKYQRDSTGITPDIHCITQYW